MRFDVGRWERYDLLHLQAQREVVDAMTWVRGSWKRKVHNQP